MLMWEDTAPKMKTTATFIFVCSLLVSSCVGSIWKKVSVEILNDFPVGVTLRVHCKSKQHDLGIQDIQAHWDFSFIPNFLGRSLYFCGFAWPGQFHWFDIYDQVRDEGECEICLWKIKPNGPCRFNGVTGEFDQCYLWNK